MEIAPGIHSIGQHAGGRVHAFLLEAGGKLTLIDTLYDTDARPLLEYLQRIRRPVTDIERIVLTHAHRSHLGGLRALKRISAATVYAHAWEADIVEGKRKAQPVTLRPTRPFRLYRDVYYPFQIGLALGLGKHPPCPVDEALGADDALGPLQVVHASGHTPGHLAFFWPEREVLFAGDAIATWPELAPGWPAFTLNRVEHARSLRRLAALAPRVVAVGHGEPIRENAADTLRVLAERAQADATPA
jgi:glyoxylase-like metal-dependent hydrolase (beta-lactamase superfamily II)